MMKKYLTQRYPSEGNKWNIILPISIFVGLFMLIFQPFGLSELNMDHKALILAGYGIVTFIILIFNLILIPALFPLTFSDENWTVLKEMLFLLWVIFTVGLGNLLYSSWTMGFRLSFANIVVFQVYTLAVGIIPIATLILVKQNYLTRKNEGSAELISSTLGSRRHIEAGIQQIRIASDNDKESLALSSTDLLFIRSEGNYISVGYLANGKLSKRMVRNTLKYAADLLATYPEFYQCHRSWIVNLDKIVKVRGNSQGLRLVIGEYDEDIPVARNYASDFRLRMMRSGD